MSNFIKLHWKRILGLICLITIGVIFLIGEIFKIEWLNNTVAYGIQIIIALGFITYFELNEYILWYNRWLLRKYKTNDKLVLKFKYYDKNFKPKLSELNAIVKYIVFTNNQSLIYEIAILDNDHMIEDNFIYAKINPITNGITLVTSMGENYKPKYYQYDNALGLDIDLCIKDFFKYENSDVKSISIDSIKCKKI